MFRSHLEVKIKSTTYNLCGEKVSSATIECGKAKIDIDILDEFCLSIKGVLPSCCWPIVKHWQPLDHTAISAV